MARHFYCDILDFQAAGESETSIAFKGAGCEFIAYKCTKPTHARDYASEARAVFVFEVADLDSALARLRNQGVTIIHSEPGENEHGRYAAFADPFGIVHELLEPVK